MKYLELAKRIALKVARKHGACNDELIAEAYYVLCKIQPRLENHPAPEAYITITIKFALLRYLTNHKCQELFDNYTYDYRSLIKLKDTIEAITKTDIEKRIVQYRIQHYTDKEIAELMGISKSQINLIRQKLELKYLTEVHNDETT